MCAKHFSMGRFFCEVIIEGVAKVDSVANEEDGDGNGNGKGIREDERLAIAKAGVLE